MLRATFGQESGSGWSTKAHRIPGICESHSCGRVFICPCGLFIVRPWSTSNDSMSPFAALVHAYDGLVSSWKQSATGSTAPIASGSGTSASTKWTWSIAFTTGLFGVAQTLPVHAPSGESVTVDDGAYDRDRTGDGEWVLSRETTWLGAVRRLWRSALAPWRH